MSRVLLDTDILSEIFKGRDLTVKGHADAYSVVHGRYTFSAVSVQEILFGLHCKAALRQIQLAEVLFARNEVIIPNLDDFVTTGRIRGMARRQGHQLAFDDCLIGAVASRLGIPVATGNTAHFDAMRQAGFQIELENWRLP